ncbi:MAG: SIS domain-containing protein [Propionibacteriaceae bacterium]|nr:SIS domain-containing protein [Propionibacteriaceae bacterium]
MNELTAAADTYLTDVSDVLQAAIRRNRQAIAQAGQLLADAFTRDGLAFVFGSGHSHIFAEEAFYRAGGAVRICPILKPDYMLHDGAHRSTQLERQHGLAEDVLAGYEFVAGRDVMVVVSNSGANPLPVEVAQRAAELGMTVIAITSLQYAKESRADGIRLHEVADLVLDNGCPPGDALVTLSDDLPRVGPGSSVVGLALLNAVIVDGLARQVAAGTRPDVYLSAGMPGAAKHNAEFGVRFAERIPHI